MLSFLPVFLVALTFSGYSADIIDQKFERLPGARLIEDIEDVGKELVHLTHVNEDLIKELKRLEIAYLFGQYENGTSIGNGSDYDNTKIWEIRQERQKTIQKLKEEILVVVLQLGTFNIMTDSETNSSLLENIDCFPSIEYGRDIYSPLRFMLKHSSSLFPDGTGAVRWLMDQHNQRFGHCKSLGYPTSSGTVEITSSIPAEPFYDVHSNAFIPVLRSLRDYHGKGAGYHEYFPSIQDKLNEIIENYSKQGPQLESVLLIGGFKSYCEK